MEKNDNVTRFEAITKEMISLYEKKNHDYGNSFEDSLDEEKSVNRGIARLSEKISRIKQINANGVSVNDESMEDTLIDIANYAVMNLMWLRKQSKKKKKKFVPKEGQQFFFIGIFGEIVRATFDQNNWTFDNGIDKLAGIGNCFETEKEAELYAEKFKELFNR